MASVPAVTPLTNLIISPSDLNRLKRELEVIDDFLDQAALRKGGQPTTMPLASRLLNEFSQVAHVNLLQSTDRQRLIAEVDGLIKSSPSLHISFASEPSAAFLSKLVIWLRSNIHPQLLVRVGLQPAIAAGCIVRTSNKQFDFSLAASFDKQRAVFIRSLKAAAAPASTPAAITPAPAPAEVAHE